MLKDCININTFGYCKTVGGYCDWEEDEDSCCKHYKNKHGDTSEDKIREKEQDKDIIWRRPDDYINDNDDDDYWV
jgi:hypothetical protein